MILSLAPDGSVSIIAHGELDAPIFEALGQVSGITRGGHVQPADPALRLIFVSLRKLGSSRISRFTRTWKCEWNVEIVDGPVLGPYNARSEAITAEEEYMAEKTN